MKASIIMSSLYNKYNENLLPLLISLQLSKQKISFDQYHMLPEGNDENIEQNSRMSKGQIKPFEEQDKKDYKLTFLMPGPAIEEQHCKIDLSKFKSDIQQNETEQNNSVQQLVKNKDYWISNEMLHLINKFNENTIEDKIDYSENNNNQIQNSKERYLITIGEASLVLCFSIDNVSLSLFPESQKYACLENKSNKRDIVNNSQEAMDFTQTKQLNKHQYSQLSISKLLGATNYFSSSNIYKIKNYMILGIPLNHYISDLNIFNHQDTSLNQLFNILHKRNYI